MTTNLEQPHRRPSVLITDAEPYVCRVFAAKLTKDDQFRVSVACNRIEAFSAAAAQPFDAILWDMRLRETNTALPHLRALCPHAALLVMTTDDRPLLDAEICRLDVAHILVKPFGLDFLVDMLLRHCLSSAPAATPAARLDLACVGQQLAIVTPSGRCVTRVLSVNQDSFVVVGAPRVETPEDFAPGQPVTVQVRGEDALYSFDSRLIRSFEDPIERWELEMPEVIRREQRRKHPRRAVHLRVEIVVAPDRVFSETTARGGAATLHFVGTTENISAGGFAAISQQPLPVGTAVDFVLSEVCAEASGCGMVVRTQPAKLSPRRDSTRDTTHLIAVKFTHLNPEAARYIEHLVEYRS
jgi:c-di-GMP-binding flagellar brake protein YcgR/ActR/RegA family two-component response regulator